MRVTTRVAATLILAGLAPGLCAAARPARTAQAARPKPATRAKARPAPPLSFLRENSYSLKDVIEQIRGDRQLLLRFANHFHIAPERVIPYFEQNLVESYVPETKRYTVWMKRKDGSTFWAYQTFRKGERVLSLRNGEPVLKWACGNPLMTKLPEIQKRKVVERTAKVLPNVQKRTRYYDVETPFETPKEVVEEPVLLAGLPPEFNVPFSEMTHIETRELIPVRASSPWPAAALLALNFDKNTRPIDVIPEPSSAALALLGLAGVGMFTRTRRG